MNSYLLVFVLLLASCAICKMSLGNSLPDGFYDIEFNGNGDCTSPSKFTYKQLNVCAINVNNPKYYETTTCTAKDFQTKNDCGKDCASFCGGSTKGPLGCLSISGGYSVLCTCGPAPQVLSGNTWLLEYKSASGNCTSSVLESGVVADRCFPTSFREGIEHQCTASTRTEIKYHHCELISCDGCTVESKITTKDMGVCQDSKVSITRPFDGLPANRYQTFECVTA